LKKCLCDGEENSLKLVMSVLRHQHMQSLEYKWKDCPLGDKTRAGREQVPLKSGRKRWVQMKWKDPVAPNTLEEK